MRGAAGIRALLLAVSLLLSPALFGEAVPPELLEKAQKGDAAAQCSLGELYLSQKDSANALKWLQMAAERGNADAQVALGRVYRNGTGVPRDLREAARWYRKAADQGSIGAENSLGSMYESGAGVPEDHAEAAIWYRRAAEQGSAEAQTNLGLLCENGIGVTKDAAEATKWYRMAAQQGDVDALRALSRIEPDDIVLRDGRVFHSATIFSESPSTVTIRYRGGMSSADKALLPERLSAIYPVYAQSEPSVPQAPPAVPTMPAPRERAPRPERAAPVEDERRAQVEAVKAVKQAAKRYADHYFRYEYLSGVAGAVVQRLDVDLEEPSAVDGWTGRYAVEGNCSMQFFDSAGLSYGRSVTGRFTVSVDYDGRKAKVVDFTNHVAP
jgi:hypothetical protein